MKPERPFVFSEVYFSGQHTPNQIKSAYRTVISTEWLIVIDIELYLKGMPEVRFFTRISKGALLKNNYRCGYIKKKKNKNF